jgi:two-component system cell cycle sensor histidine kinase/response regulator CckA
VRRVVGQDLTPGDYVVLEVSDTGMGMSAETAQRIFEPFFTTKFSGRGLGLAATLGILKGHHGGIELTSSEGHGATFALYFPAIGRAKDPHAPEVPQKRERSQLKLSVLLVDDEEGVRKALQQLLEYLGHRVRVARDGFEALATLEAERAQIDLVIMDVTMPGLDGVEAEKRISQKWPDLPVILSSGYADAHHDGNGVTFLQKPYKLDRLEKVLSEVMARRRAVSAS